MARTVEQAGGGTLSVLTLGGELQEWSVGDEDGVAWTVHDDGSLDIFFRDTLAVAGVGGDIVASFSANGWQCVRWQFEPPAGGSAG